MSHDSTPHGRIPTDTMPAAYLTPDALYRALAIASDIAFTTNLPQTLLGVRDNTHVLVCGCQACAFLLGTFTVLPDHTVELITNGIEIHGSPWLHRKDGRSALVIVGTCPEEAVS